MTRSCGVCWTWTRSPTYRGSTIQRRIDFGIAAFKDMIKGTEEWHLGIYSRLHVKLPTPFRKNLFICIYPSAAEHCRTLTKPRATSIHSTRGTGLQKMWAPWYICIVGYDFMRIGSPGGGTKTTAHPGQAQAEVRRDGHQNLSAMRKFVLEVWHASDCKCRILGLREQ